MKPASPRTRLHEQYITQGRSLTTLARETGVFWRTMADWAQRHNIPLRRTNGVHRLGQDMPRS